MDLKEDLCCVQNPAISHESLHLHRMGAITPTSPSSISRQKSPALDPEYALHSSSLNAAMCKAGYYPGTLSLHNYRRFLSLGESSSSFPIDDGPDGKILRRKNANAALNLNQSQLSLDQYAVFPFAVPSATSSPPPLSPSYSPSAVSEQGPESLDGFLLSPSPVDWTISAENSCSRQNPHRLLDTFRARLERYPDMTPSNPLSNPANPAQPRASKTHSKTYSDSALLTISRKRHPTITHHGTAFEILNPHESLRFARIVSYIEDLDTNSIHRESYFAPDSHSHNMDIDMSMNMDLDTDSSTPESNLLDLVTDSPRHHPMPSISERLETPSNDLFSSYSHTHSHSHSTPKPQLQPHPQSHPQTYRPWTSHSTTSSTTISTTVSSLGEPGSPIREDTGRYANIPSHDHLWQEVNDYNRYFNTGYTGAITAAPKSEVRVVRRPTRRSTVLSASARKRSRGGPLRRLCGIARALRRKRGD